MSARHLPWRRQRAGGPQRLRGFCPAVTFSRITGINHIRGIIKACLYMKERMASRPGAQTLIRHLRHLRLR